MTDRKDIKEDLKAIGKLSMFVVVSMIGVLGFTLLMVSRQIEMRWDGFNQSVEGFPQTKMKNCPFSSGAVGALVEDSIIAIGESPEGVEYVSIECIKGRLIGNGENERWERYFHNGHQDNVAGDYTAPNKIRIVWIPDDYIGDTALAYEIIRRHFKREPYKGKYDDVIEDVKNKHRK